MTINQLQYFMSLATRLNFRAVAERYFITQPTLSRQIAALEDELGVKLFERNKHGVELTEAGKTLEAGLPDIYQQLSALLLETKETAAMGSKHLTIVIQDDQVISPELMDAITAFRKEEPDVHIRLDRVPISSLYTSFPDQQFDIANVIDLDGQFMHDLEFQPLREEDTCLAIQTELVEGLPDSVTAHEVDLVIQKVPLHLISMEYYDSVSEPIQSLRNNLHLDLPDGRVHFENKLESLPLRVAAGLCTTIVNESHTMSYDPKIRLLSVKGANVYHKGILYHPENTNPALQRFMKYIDM